MGSGWMTGVRERIRGRGSSGSQRFTNSDNRGETVRTVAINNVREMVEKREHTTCFHNNF